MHVLKTAFSFLLTLTELVEVKKFKKKHRLADLFASNHFVFFALLFVPSVFFFVAAKIVDFRVFQLVCPYNRRLDFHFSYLVRYSAFPNVLTLKFSKHFFGKNNIIFKIFSLARYVESKLTYQKKAIFYSEMYFQIQDCITFPKSWLTKNYFSFRNFARKFPITLSK